MSTANNPNGAAEDLPEDVSLALNTVLYYVFDDELGDFRLEPRSGHVFPHLVTIEAWLSGERLTVEEFVGEVEEV